MSATAGFVITSGRIWWSRSMRLSTRSTVTSGIAIAAVSVGP
jgi:hypothetical protein